MALVQPTRVLYVYPCCSLINYIYYIQCDYSHQLSRTRVTLIVLSLQYIFVNKI